MRRFAFAFASEGAGRAIGCALSALCWITTATADDQSTASGVACCTAGQCIRLVPELVYERRVIEVTEYRNEVCQKIVTVHKVVPEQKQVRDIHIDMVSRVERQRETCVEYVPVWREVTQQVEVLVPTEERRTSSRRVCQRVQVEEWCLQNIDRGCWEEVYLHGCLRRVWRPNLVTERVPVPVWREQFVDEPYEYSVIVHRPETRSVQVRVCDFQRQEREREFERTVCVPQAREAVRHVSTYRTVAEQQEQTTTTRVPYIVRKEMEVPVCRWVPQRDCACCRQHSVAPQRTQ